MNKFLACALLLLSMVGVGKAQTHTFPATDTNNIFTGTNTFNKATFPSLIWNDYYAYSTPYPTIAAATTQACIDAGTSGPKRVIIPAGSPTHNFGGVPVCSAVTVVDETLSPAITYVDSAGNYVAAGLATGTVGTIQAAGANGSFVAATSINLALVFRGTQNCNLTNYFYQPATNTCVLNSGATGTAGAKGDTGASGEVSTVQLNDAISQAIYGNTATTPGDISGNLFNVATVHEGVVIDSTTGAEVTTSGYSSTDFVYVHHAGFVISNQVMQGFQTEGYAFYDINRTYISGSAYNVTVNPNTPLAVPGPVYYIRFWWQDGGTPLPAAMIVNSGSTLLPTYQAYNTNTGTSSTVTTDGLVSQVQLTEAIGANRGSIVGKKFINFGDSISIAFGTQWQDAVATSTGSIFNGNKAESGRHWYEIFTEYITGASGPTPGTLNTSALQTDLAANDFITIEMGTNDVRDLIGSVISVGSITDTPVIPLNAQNSGPSTPQPYTVSFYAYVMGAIDELQRLAPTKKIVLIGPYHLDRNSTFTVPPGGFDFTTSDPFTDQIVTALKAIADSRGLYLVDLSKTSGFNKSTVSNPDGSPEYLRDGLHPSDTLGYPSISRQIAQKMVAAF